MITPFKIIGAQQRYNAHLMAIIDFMNNALTLMDSGTIIKDIFKE